MEIKKLHESDELQDRAKKHKKNNKGLSSFCTLNTDAGNVEHNVAMFNHMNTPVESPSVNPCGPMAEDLNLEEEKTMDLTELHYDNLKVTVVTKPQRPASYYFDYDRDEAETAEDRIEYDYSVPRSEIVDFIYENMTENDFAEIDTASEAEVVAFINKNFDTLFNKYEPMILDYYRESATEEAERRMTESVTTSELTKSTQMMEAFIRSIDTRLHETYCSKKVNENAQKELNSLKSLYEKYANVHDEDHMNRIIEKMSSVLASCADNKAYLNEATNLDTQYAQDALSDRIQDLVDFGLSGYRSRALRPHVYRVNNRNGNTSVVVEFDMNDFSKKFVFSVDGVSYTANSEDEAARIIKRSADRKYAKSFDLAVEGLSDRIRKDELEYDDSIDAWTAAQGDTEVQFQDREQHTHEFRTKKNQWGRSYVDGQYNKQPKVASHSWGRVWKDGKLVKQAEGPKYQVRADIAKYLDAEGNLDEAKIPDNWKQYRGAWMYPVYDGWEANLDGLHYEAETEDELKLKIDSAVRGGFTRDNKLAQLHREADRLPPYGGMLDEDIDDVTRYQMEFYLDGDDVRHTRYIYADSTEEACEKLQAMVGNHSLTAVIPETVPARYKEWDMEEGWSPDLVDCPACGDVSFDSRRGKCTRCTYRESLITEEDDGRNVGISFDVNAPSDMSESQIEDIIRKALAPTELLINSYMEIHTLDESVNEALNGYKVTITKNDETFDDYASAYEEENAIQQMINKYGKDIKVTNVQVQKKVNEASYGGAFDIADDQYFTREDLVDCANKVIEHLNETFDDVFEISNVELNGTIFKIEVEGKDLGWYMEKCRIDMRKIRIPSDLTNKYALEFASKFIATIKDYNDL